MGRRRVQGTMPAIRVSPKVEQHAAGQSIVIPRYLGYHLAETYTTLMISLFLFVLSWAVYAGVFFAASQSCLRFIAIIGKRPFPSGF